MKPSTLSAAIAVPHNLTSHNKYRTDYFILYGAPDATGVSPNYTLGTVVDTFPTHISK